MKYWLTKAIKKKFNNGNTKINVVESKCGNSQNANGSHGEDGRMVELGEWR